jgi:5-methyltetrahydrofolate--homocysteine methyltransferase
VPPAFRYDPDNFYWRFTQAAIAGTFDQARGKLLIQFPDLIEGLDTLAAMRGTQQLLMDLVERPEWVQACLRQITDLYFHYYDLLYDLIRDEVGGSVFWVWAPGRLAKFQCDFSAMISPGMFREFMVPVLTEMSERVSYSLYHWDGPGALCHLEALLSIPHLDVLQWTPGDGIEPYGHPRWWPMYHQILESGKKLLISPDKESLPALKREFGEESKGMLLGCEAGSVAEAQELLKMMEVD